MSGIVGINDTSEEAKNLAQNMLDKINHRGRAGSDVISTNGGTLGIVWTDYQSGLKPPPVSEGSVQDFGLDGREARARILNGNLELTRDRFGIAPMYYGSDGQRICFASEIKALLLATPDVNILPPGCLYDGNIVISHFAFNPGSMLVDNDNTIMMELRTRLDRAVQKCIDKNEVGILLSGGLDSSVITVLAIPYAKLHTFSIGLTKAPDLEASRWIAQSVRTTHHEIVVTLQQILDILPEVIYHFESFDALLVRSSMINYIVAKEAINYVPTILVGEGADGLFAGFGRYSNIALNNLSGELAKDVMSMHNQGLQRVDRCSMAHGLVAYVPFLNIELAEYAIRIPPRMKIVKGTEKWILRKIFAESLPQQIVNRPKDVFWSSAGVRDLLSDYASEHISPEEFARERILPNGWTINTPEELMYYRIFKDCFGSAADNPTWIGRTKGAPFIEAEQIKKE